MSRFYYANRNSNIDDRSSLELTSLDEFRPGPPSRFNPTDQDGIPDAISWRVNGVDGSRHTLDGAKGPRYAIESSDSLSQIVCADEFGRTRVVHDRGHLDDAIGAAQAAQLTEAAGPRWDGAPTPVATPSTTSGLTESEPAALVGSASSPIAEAVEASVRAPVDEGIADSASVEQSMPVNTEPVAEESAPVEAAPVAPAPEADGFLLGVNLAGAEFGADSARYGYDYIYPGDESVDYYASKGMDVIRLPFQWEHLQPAMNGPLDPEELQRIETVVDYANSKGMKVILDVHDYGYGYGNMIGTSDTPNAAFADFWGKLAGEFADNPDVIFGLMNEPHDQSAGQWLESANAAIAAIREAGATQQVLVPGTYWDGAWSWTTSDNASVIGTGIKDPANNFAFEVHQYLDSNGSGTNPNIASETIGVERLAAATAWAEETGNKLFLGEFGVADDPTSLAALDNMLTYMRAHPDAWQGAAYWAGGPWWGDYMYSVEPTGGVDKPQMDVLEQHA